MGADIEKFGILLNDEEKCLREMKEALGRLQAAGRARHAETVSLITVELIGIQERMSLLDRNLLELIRVTAAETGIAEKEFKIAAIDRDGRLAGLIDSLRMMTSDIARLSAETAGVLSADIDVIEETVRILESIDSRAVGYGPVKASVSSGSRLLDRSA